ncbi:hypothetical protein GLAREA_10510 [Glarea lozoyensis ATCC 20868]|uniref:Uncharacterized protein n=1 Tax=Glarea lozoyensis (strain ATCC 20868 / MF5171) TaxID=1116229 RepID=S3DAU2_GLAL2|nr:uncharacterized protein GLAREA_10510 [Glarea lozoyensis ATCC 20868]EPE34815.1 hypothetical protein GLAREA_10510 [Glarea lozoyensis ATCC 20868]
MHSVLIIFGVLIILNLTTASPLLPIDGLDLPWPVAPLRSSYHVTPESEPISLEEDVHTKIEEFRATHGTANFNDAAPNIRTEKPKRDKIKPGLCCLDIPHRNWPNAYYACGVTARNELAQKATVSIPGHSCVRGNEYPVEPPGEHLASHVHDIQQMCTYTNSDDLLLSCGQQLDTNGYNVILRGGGQRCPEGKDPRLETCASASYWNPPPRLGAWPLPEEFEYRKIENYKPPPPEPPINQELSIGLAPPANGEYLGEEIE